jgi:hypothetical protein
MADVWTEKLTCATNCHRCKENLNPKDQRILSVYDHEAICMACKREEETRSDYEVTTKQMIGQCMIDTEMEWGDPQGFCYHHFYPFKC